MAELLDRALQHELLRAMQDTYPAPTQAERLQEISPGNALQVNLRYLEEHRLVEVQAYDTLDGTMLSSARITARGLDFLADDGGLGAILGVVTVRLHEDTLKELVAAKIRGSDLAQSDKQRYLDQLRELPAETTKHLVLKLVDAGLENWHRALPLLQSTLGM